jgi:hypothetical protein
MKWPNPGCRLTTLSSRERTVQLCGPCTDEALLKLAAATNSLLAHIEGRRYNPLLPDAAAVAKHLRHALGPVLLDESNAPPTIDF